MVRKKHTKKGGNSMSIVRLCLMFLLVAITGTAAADACDENILFEGKGAGQVIFDMNVHLAKGLTCADCHEARGYSLALFEMKRGADAITMRKMELGSSCGACHDGTKAFSVSNNLSCSLCHHK